MSNESTTNSTDTNGGAFDDQVQKLTLAVRNILSENVYDSPFGVHVDFSHIPTVEGVSGPNWIVRVYEASAEVINGSADGSRMSAGYHYDLKGMLAKFDTVDEVVLRSKLDGSDGVCGMPHVELTGVYGGFHLSVFLCTATPSDATTQRHMDPNTMLAFTTHDDKEVH